ncbi:Glycosyltransferase family 17 [alpha proteobacterium HIMB5]|nr:Glycosyltransferase family 17 [alpha proteobacterium HIMB5]
MFYDEDVILDLRLNILNEYIDYFVIVESKFFHNGKERKLRFDIKKYTKFRDKIIYIIQDNQPSGIQEILKDDSTGTISAKEINNALLRENSQRDLISQGLKMANDNDLILISDVDEIPNLEKTKLKETKNEILMFVQDIFYYKLNRYLPNFQWFGTKGCLKKNLKSPQWLRNIKNKKYSFYRVDTFFSDKKYINKKFINHGGWHFSNLKNAEDLELKLKSYLHHRDYEVEELGKTKIKELMKTNETIYDMFGDKTSKKYGDDKRRKLDIYEINKLPIFIQKNLEKYKNWID